MARLVEALKKVGQTFELFQRGEIGPCESTPSAVSIPNLVPSTFCQVPVVAPGVEGDGLGEGVGGPTAEHEVIDPSDQELQIAPTDENVDVRAKFALKRMLNRTDCPDMQRDAARLILGLKGKKLERVPGKPQERAAGKRLEGIYGDDLGVAVKVANDHKTKRWLLVPEEENAALVLGVVGKTASLDVPPTVIFRGDTPDISKEPGLLEKALGEASKTFALFQDNKLVLCASSPSAESVANLVPPSYCRVSGRLISLRLCTPTGEPIAGAPYSLTMGSDVAQGVTDGEGFLTEHVPSDQAWFVVDWSDPNATDPTLASFTRKVWLDLGPAGDEADRRRLANLGYLSATLQGQLDEFRAEFGRPQSVSDGELRLQARAWHDGGERPQPSPEEEGV